MERLKHHFKKLNQLKGPYVKGHFSARTSFKCSLTASFSKSIELGLAIFEDDVDKQAYYKTSSLRGLCEEIIVLKYLHNETFPYHNKIIVLLMQDGLRKDLIAQENFFKENHSFQPVLELKNFKNANSTKQEIKEILNGLGIAGNKLPPVEQMAQKVGLESLYNYLYRATSNFVHFNPGHLFRMGWGDIKEDKKVKEIEFEFKPENFHRYYNAFNKFYVSFLIVTFSKVLKNQIGLKGEIWKTIKSLEKDLDKYLTWPEMVTYEEMNLKRPSEIFTILNRSVKNLTGI